MRIQHKKYNYIWRGESFFGITILSFVYFCEDMSDEVRTTETCSRIICEGKFLQQIYICI